MTGSWPPADFPNLIETNHVIESPETRRYNCIGWAAGSNTLWWWPAGSSYWPPNVPREATMSAFIQAFGTLGYIQCSDGSLEPGFEKIALYAVFEQGVPVPTHAARQLPSGRWTSKLGNSFDIEHMTLDAVNCPTYGAPIYYLRRAARAAG